MSKLKYLDIKSVSILKDRITSQINTDINYTKKLITAIHNCKPSIETLDDFFKVQATSDIYQTKVWKCAYNPSPICEKMGANAGLVCEPSTDTVEGRDDYADKIEFMWWRCNYTRDDYGNKVVTAIEGDENYAEDGTVDVGTIGMTFYYGYDKDSSDEYDMLSWSTKPNDELNLYPFTDSVMVDGTVRPYYILSAFPSSLGDDGLLHSQPYKKIVKKQSYQKVVADYAKKGTNVRGAGASRNTFQIVFNLIKYANKSSQANFAGVTNWDFQYAAAVQREEKDTYFPVTAAQAANLEVGCCVSVGYASIYATRVRTERSFNNWEAYASNVKILKIEDMDDGNKAVYLDTDEGFDTMPVVLSDTITSQVYLTTIFAQTGETNIVIGRHDGSVVSNVSGRHSYRIQGVEYGLGGYIVASDTMCITHEDYSFDVYTAPKDKEILITETQFKANAEFLGTVLPTLGNSYVYRAIGDINIDPKTGGYYIQSESDSISQGYCDRYYLCGNTADKGHCFATEGMLSSQASGGSASIFSSQGLGESGEQWYYCSAD